MMKQKRLKQLTYPILTLINICFENKKMLLLFRRLNILSSLIHLYLAGFILTYEPNFYQN